jgi:plasmid stability protein
MATRIRKSAQRNQMRCHNGTVNLTIKNLPGDIHKVLKRIAAERGRSLNAEVIFALSEAAEDAERHRRMRESRTDLESFVNSLPRLPRGYTARLIREDRDSR